MATEAQLEKARQIVFERRVQILARSERGAMALITSQEGRIYQATVLTVLPFGSTDTIPTPSIVGGTCTCKHGREREDPIYSHARGEGCKHYRALLMALGDHVVVRTTAMYDDDAVALAEEAFAKALRDLLAGTEAR